MIDIKLIRENKDLVKENIKKKFQDEKLPLVDEVLVLDEKFRNLKLEGDNLRKERNDKSSEIGMLIRDKRVNDADLIKEEVSKINNKVPDFEIPYHADILERMNGLDKDASGRTSGNGFYYLLGDGARLSTAMINYARDYMIDKGFIYAIPPFMIKSDVVTGVMSFEEMDAMMYKIEGENLYLIGTSEHSMIGKFKDQILKE